MTLAVDVDTAVDCIVDQCCNADRVFQEEGKEEMVKK